MRSFVWKWRIPSLLCFIMSYAWYTEGSVYLSVGFLIMGISMIFVSGND